MSNEEQGTAQAQPPVKVGDYRLMREFPVRVSEIADGGGRGPVVRIEYVQHDGLSGGGSCWWDVSDLIPLETPEQFIQTRIHEAAGLVRLHEQAAAAARAEEAAQKRALVALRSAQQSAKAGR